MAAFLAPSSLPALSSSFVPEPSHLLFSLRPRTVPVPILSSASPAGVVAFAIRRKGRHPKFPEEWKKGQNREPEPPSSPDGPDPPKEEVEQQGDAEAASAGSITDEWGEKSEPEPYFPSYPDPPKDEDEWGTEPGDVVIDPTGSVTDEWGEKSEPEPYFPSYPDPPKDEDEWGAEPGDVVVAPTGSITDEWGDKCEPEPYFPSNPDPPKDEDEWGTDPGDGAAASAGAITDEWGEKSKPETEPTSLPDPTRDDDEWGTEPGAAAGGSAAAVTDERGEKMEPESVTPYQAESPKDDDEWGQEDYLPGNGTTPVASDDKLGDLKRCLVDSLYGTELGARASIETRAEIFELVSQLEAANPTAAPTESPELLDGNWIFLFTAFSEILPLLAVGATPLLKIKRISQTIDSKTMTAVNTATLSSPVATFSFNASASFEVRSSSRIQMGNTLAQKILKWFHLGQWTQAVYSLSITMVQFKEGSFQPPEISSSLNLPEKVDIFGQKIDLKPVQRTLNLIQEAAASITRSISGLPPLRVAIPGNRAELWLLITYLDEDFRISRGDGGLFILAKEGSPLLDRLS